MTITSIILLLVGLGILMFAGEQFVSGASDLANALRITPVIVGVVVLGFGTSAPELVVSALAAIRGDPALGVGNVIGSNVANLSLGLGLAAVISPVAVAYSLLKKEAAISVVSVLVFAALVVDGNLALWEGILLSALLIVGIATLIKTAEQVPELNIRHSAEYSNPVPAAVEQKTERPKTGWLTLRTVLGLGGVLVGAQLAVQGAGDLAEAYGFSDGVVGFTVVAIGTSLPELATVVAAARKGQTQLILGNLLGSNMFNSFAVGGAMGLVGAGAINDDTLTQFGVGAMVFVVVVAYLMAYSNRRVGRPDGVLLLLLYFAAMVLLGVLS